MTTPIWGAFDSHDQVRCPKCGKPISGFPDTSTEPEHPFAKTCPDCGLVIHYAVRRAYTRQKDCGGNFEIGNRR